MRSVEGLGDKRVRCVNTAVSLSGLALKNPVMTASGTCGYGPELAPFFELDRLGALVVKGISVAPRPGNPPPRIAETCGGMLNAIGLENIGLESFVRDCLPVLCKTDTVRIVNILGETVDEYGVLVETLSDQEGVDGIEVNVSCPNVRKGGIAFGAEPRTLGDLIRDLRKRTQKPLIVKLSPNVTDIAEMARRAAGAGADAVSLINTLRGMSVDPETRKPRLSTVIGGLSGPAVKPVALRMVWEVASAVNIPVVGIGGILRAEDVVEFLLCGATAVQVGTAQLLDPYACVRIIEGLEGYMERHGIDDVRELVGGLQTGGAP